MTPPKVGIKELPFDLKPLPENISNIDSEKLTLEQSIMLDAKRALRRYIDNIDTEIISIKEELRKRKEKSLADRNLRGDYTQG
jgi:hypothetical protein